MLSLDTRFVTQAVADHEWQQLETQIIALHEALEQGRVPGADFRGWIHLPSQTLAEGLDPLLETAASLRDEIDALIVIGIGGSYLGARAALEFCRSPYWHLRSREQRGGPAVYFAGNDLSGPALADLMRVLEGQRVALNVVSKSGTTTEPAVAFRVLRHWLAQKMDAETVRRRIIVTTDRQRGALRKLADEEGYLSFVIPDDVGGRFSVLTPVGLLPLAVAGIDIRALLEGAASQEQALARPELRENPAYRYAAIRQALYRKGKTVEILVTYEPSLRMFAEWWKQLFGESEGKDGKGIYPASAAFTTDLHSLGQFIQEGYRHLFETVVHVDDPGEDVTLPSDPGVDDGLEYLAGRSIAWINDQARLATHVAHADGGVPNLLVRVADRSERSLGELFYFFERAVAMSGLLAGVNPFDQPGVEAYKRNMFALLGKPGYEEDRRKMMERLGHQAR
ncbi:MAG: glucose-6-phosphate isomerase [Thermoflavifilum sp.]|nr:glucose-6-phosphate isomerase [Thermoflavifilum sp.]MCL6512950.1 glucose-6-phosphate isomerase [Alicyclobacillus sp.]